MSKKRILIIDDEQIICRGLERELTEKGYETDSAGSCDEALIKVKAGHYDLIFVDFVLPGKNGVETCKEIRKIDTQVKLVFMTGMLETDPIFKEIEFIEAGGQSYYLYKPFMQGEILEAAGKVLRD